MAGSLPTPTATVPRRTFRGRRHGIRRGHHPPGADPHQQARKPRFEIGTYAVQERRHRLWHRREIQPPAADLLYGNFNTLFDDPHRLHPDQMLNILPVDGVLYDWTRRRRA